MSLTKAFIRTSFFVSAAHHRQQMQESQTMLNTQEVTKERYQDDKVEVALENDEWCSVVGEVESSGVYSVQVIRLERRER